MFNILAIGTTKTRNLELYWHEFIIDFLFFQKLFLEGKHRKKIGLKSNMFYLSTIIVVKLHLLL